MHLKKPMYFASSYHDPMHVLSDFCYGGRMKLMISSRFKTDIKIKAIVIVDKCPH